MSGQKQLSPCCVMLHESWANFPAKNYKRVLVFVAFLTPEGELLLMEDKKGNWGLPFEHFRMWDMLRRVPERVINKSLGLSPEQVSADERALSQTKLLGACEIGSDYCVVLSVKITPPRTVSRWRLVAGEALLSYAKQQPILSPVVDSLWPREVAAA